MSKDELTMRDLLLLILKKQEEIEERLAKVEAVAHPQSVMADPVLTELIRKLFEKKDEDTPHEINDTDRTSPYIPTTTPLPPWQVRWPTITVC